MKNALLFVCLGLSTLALSQRNLNGKSRKDFFGGARDYRNITNNGLQISFGPNYTLTRDRFSETKIDANGQRLSYDIDPAGRFGAYIDIGMAHYRMKSSKVLDKWYQRRKARLGKDSDKEPGKLIGGNLIHRIDWGLGFDYIGGKEYTNFNVLDNMGNTIGSNQGEGKFYNGYLYGRVTADRFTKIGDSWHLETGLGLNFNYAILQGSKDYSSQVFAEQKFQRPFLTQFHGHLGFNYKIRRGDYLVFGFYAPILGIYEPNRLKPTIQWYSSNYYPLHLQVKWIHHFTKKTKGCNTGSDEDRKRNEEYMQNR